MHSMCTGLSSAKIVAVCNANVFLLGIDFLFHIAFSLPEASCLNQFS